MEITGKFKNILIPAILIVVFIVLAITSALNKSLTCDEAAHHIPPGYVFLTKGDFVFATDSPPLARFIAAFPMLFMDINLPENREFWARDDRADFSKEFLYKLNRDYVEKITFWGRFGITLVAAFGGVFLFFRYWGERVKY